ncbi:hypothetical protein [Halomonas sp. DN3]|uniref:hypothetical protein n=1 Tax=Halomonas sp. DN3 TaxID=2953657 RepID=UPI00209FE32C|nr:hypothetical protein [Halomonas sp. DN3]USZ51292.1 hypothetical protein NKF27_07300 [Halomonas sp. DN3]
MKKRVIGGVALLLVSSLLVHLWPRQPPDDVLDRMQGILGKLEEMYEGETIFIWPYTAEPDGLDSERVKWIRREMRETGFSRVSLSCSEHGCSSSYFIAKGLYIFRYPMYYRYDSVDILEEIIVNNVEKAIEESIEKAKEENISVHYAFCERTQVEHWFYCENNH